MAPIQVDIHAYTIPLLHGAKYPSSAVCGVLLGKNTTEGLQVKTAVPFFHHWTTLTPMLEVALKQTDIYAKANDMRIVGWYQGNERADDTTLPERAIKAAETIKKNNEDKAIIFLLNNKQYTSLTDDESAITPYVNIENQWKKVKEAFTTEDISLVQTDTFTKLRDSIDRSAYHQIYDFDEHVENVSLDWLNTSKLVL